jgi:hypothetical protein
VEQLPAGKMRKRALRRDNPIRLSLVSLPVLLLLLALTPLMCSEFFDRILLRISVPWTVALSFSPVYPS